eukprot:359841-Chlamydomonas_euryale.AAC.12
MAKAQDGKGEHSQHLAGLLGCFPSARHIQVGSATRNSDWRSPAKTHGASYAMRDEDIHYTHTSEQSAPCHDNHKRPLERGALVGFELVVVFELAVVLQYLDTAAVLVAKVLGHQRFHVIGAGVALQVEMCIAGACIAGGRIAPGREGCVEHGLAGRQHVEREPRGRRGKDA